MIFSKKKQIQGGNIAEFAELLAENLRNSAKNFMRYRPSVHKGGGSNIVGCASIAEIFWQKTFDYIAPSLYKYISARVNILRQNLSIKNSQEIVPANKCYQNKYL
jgi:hypothetical protein